MVSFCTVFVAFYLLHEFTTARQMLGAKKYIQGRGDQHKAHLSWNCPKPVHVPLSKIKHINSSKASVKNIRIQWRCHEEWVDKLEILCHSFDLMERTERSRPKNRKYMKMVLVLAMKHHGSSNRIVKHILSLNKISLKKSVFYCTNKCGCIYCNQASSDTDGPLVPVLVWFQRDHALVYVFIENTGISFEMAILGIHTICVHQSIQFRSLWPTMLSLSLSIFMTSGT